MISTESIIEILRLSPQNNIPTQSPMGGCRAGAKSPGCVPPHLAHLPPRGEGPSYVIMFSLSSFSTAFKDLPPSFQNFLLHLLIDFDDRGEGTQSLVGTTGIDDCPGTEPGILLGQNRI
jgi:hypothetical protein